jgi:predicted site-specific integrase-resolvase
MGGLKSPYRLKTTQNKNNTKMKAVIYARVSSTGERQSTERQILDLEALLNSFKMGEESVE